MTEPRRVLVTGSAGTIGRAVCKALAQRGHHVRGFDRRASPAADEAITASLVEREALDAAVEGIDCVIHLAATINEAPFVADLVPNNVVGLYHVMEAARRAAVPRVVLASSIQAVGAHLDLHQILAGDGAAAPANHYGLTKSLAEQMGAMYAQQHGMHVLAVRFGWLPRDEEEATRLSASPAGPRLYLSHNDAGRFCACALENDWDGYHLLSLTSRPLGQAMVSLEPARAAVGYEPADIWPGGLPFAFACAGNCAGCDATKKVTGIDCAGQG